MTTPKDAFCVLPASKLKNALAELAGVYGRTTLPILKCVLIEGSKDKLTLTARNPDQAVHVELEAAGNLDWSGCVNFARFLAAVSRMPSSEAKLAAQKDKLHLSGDTEHAEFPVMPAVDFPPLARLEAEPVTIPNAAVFGERLLAACEFASDEPARYTLNGVCLDSPKAGACMVAINGRTLIKVVMDNLPQWGQSQAIVPTAAARLVGARLSEAKTPCQIWITENAAAFACGPWLLQTRLIEGVYCQYEMVIPKPGGKIRWDVPAEEFKRALGFTETMMGDYPQVSIESDAEGLSLSAIGKDIGSGRQRIKCKTKGSASPVGMGPKYLRQMLRAITGETLTFEMEDDLRPSRLAHENTTVVVAPIRLQ